MHMPGWLKPKAQGPWQGHHRRATHEWRAGWSQETSVLPAVLVSHVVRQLEIVDFVLCFLLSMEQGQVPVHSHGKSKASHSLMKEQQGGYPSHRGHRAWGAVHTKTNSSIHRKMSGRCRTHLFRGGPKEGQAENTYGFGIRCFQQGKIMRLHCCSPWWSEYTPPLDFV